MRLKGKKQMNGCQDADELWRIADHAATIGDSKKVVITLEQLANIGFVEVLSTIGTLYEAGGGNLDKNAQQAVEWFRKSLEFCDDPVAHVGLGRAHYYNLGGADHNFDKALFHFSKAYKDGFPEALLYMGIITYEGKAIEKNMLKAEEYFKQAASHGYCLAYIYLARLAFSKLRLVRASYYFLTAHFKTWTLRGKDASDRKLIGMLD